ncbi:MAG: excinuclease ABC subunit UvrC [Desulfobacteraceae bacterium]|nr:MAG: excinuclease ABC subunit UvrC [Desulfobacteraceae bacterium]
MIQDQPSTGIELNPETLRKTLPEGPGVYLYRDGEGQVIYVGKAKNLKKRVLSYFKSSGDIPHKTVMMMERAASLDYILTATEKEAFILEDNLVKKWMPRYNIILRDDKQYLSLRLDTRQAYPNLTLVRRMKKDGARYFGPFSSAQSIRNTLKLIERTFQLRKCKGAEPDRRKRPCINYQLHRCFGLCSQPAPENAYREVIKEVILFLEGRSRELLGNLKEKMTKASEEMRFEDAARIRDQIRSVEKVIEHQHVVSPEMEDRDVIGLARKESTNQLVVLFVRRGRLTDSREFRIQNGAGSSLEVMESFLKQYYHQSPFIPTRILVSEPVEDMLAISNWLSDLAGRRVVIEHPRKGDKKHLVELALTNAVDLLSRAAAKHGEELMERTKTMLQLQRLPRRVEGLDISNIHGDKAVGALVSFVDGLPHRAGYRSFRIGMVQGIDDYAMMAEMVSRRMRKGDLPDLFLVDGGRGHLQTVKRVMDEAGISNSTQVASIAKEHEEGGPDRIYIPGRKNPINLKENDPVLLFLMRVRDEAHRRAVLHHRKLRGKVLTASDLDKIPGLGPNRKRILLRHFGDVHAVAGATAEDLEKVRGIGHALARDIVRYFSASDDYGLTEPKGL